MCNVITDEIFPIEYLKSQSTRRFSIGFLSPETELFFIKMHIIHALAETT